MTTVVRSERRPLMTRMTEPWPRLMDWFEAMVPGDPTWRNAFTHSMRVEEFSRDGDFVVRAEMPGINPEKGIDITIEDGFLIIDGRREESTQEGARSEFFYGHFQRTLALPSGVDAGSVQAEYRDGILEICVHMPEKRTEAVHVPVTRRPASA